MKGWPAKEIYNEIIRELTHVNMLQHSDYYDGPMSGYVKVNGKPGYSGVKLYWIEK